MAGVPLSPKQVLFVEHYLRTGGNATKAAAAAGYSNPEKQAFRVLKTARVAAEIERRKSEIRTQTDLAVDELKERLKLLMLGTMADLFEPDHMGRPQLRPMGEWGRLRGLVNEISVSDSAQQGYRCRMKGIDPLAAAKLWLELEGILKQEDATVPVGVVVVSPSDLRAVAESKVAEELQAKVDLLTEMLVMDGKDPGV